MVHEIVSAAYYMVITFLNNFEELRYDKIVL